MRHKASATRPRSRPQLPTEGVYWAPKGSPRRNCKMSQAGNPNCQRDVRACARPHHDRTPALQASAARTVLTQAWPPHQRVRPMQGGGDACVAMCESRSWAHIMLKGQSASCTGQRGRRRGRWGAGAVDSAEIHARQQQSTPAPGIVLAHASGVAPHWRLQPHSRQQRSARHSNRRGSPTMGAIARGEAATRGALAQSRKGGPAREANSTCGLAATQGRMHQNRGGATAGEANARTKRRGKAPAGEGQSPRERTRSVGVGDGGTAEPWGPGATRGANGRHRWSDGLTEEPGRAQGTPGRNVAVPRARQMFVGSRRRPLNLPRQRREPNR
jgi:hypothetical protein